MSLSLDTIVARATPAGRGGIGVVRVSGNMTPQVAQALLGKIPQPRYATYGDFKNEDGSTIDQGLAIYFKAPHSFTGEDVLELHGHGGTVVMDMLLQRILQLETRVARPGEFSERAFLNNKIDLTQAEAIADLIEASCEQAARSAIRSLQGEFSQEINRLVEKVIHLRMYVEAAIDFPDEEIDFLSDGKIQAQLAQLIEQHQKVLMRTEQGVALKEGLKVVIIGYPNAGKSSLLNLLSGDQTAIVSDIPGTTRDPIKETILMDGMPLFLIDTAGIREAQDMIEAEGIKRTWREMKVADRVLLVIDALNDNLTQIEQHPLVIEGLKHADKLTIIRNKIDLTCEPTTAYKIADMEVINLSAKTGEGADLLKQHLKACMGHQNNENVFIARRRHLQALDHCQQHLQLADEQLLQGAGELVAEELRQVQRWLSEITGEFRCDDLLGHIFSSFCVGK